MPGPNLSQERDPIHARHLQIGEHHTHLVVTESVQGLGPGTGLEAGKPVVTHQPRECVTQPGFVVDDEGD